MAKVRGQLLRDIAALTTFGEGAEGYRDGDEDTYEDGTNAGLAQYKNGWINGGDGGGDGTWVVEGEDGKSGSGASTGRSRLRMERAMDFVDEDERYRGEKILRRALVDEDEDEDEDEESGANSGPEGDEDVSSSEMSSQQVSEDEHKKESTLEEEIEKLRQDKGGMALLLKRSNDEQQLKAAQARKHRDMWNKLLEVRILLQRLLGMANRFPRDKAYDEYCRVDGSGETRAKFKEVSRGLRGLLETLVRARAEQAAGLEGGVAGTPEGRRKRARATNAAFLAGSSHVGGEGDPWAETQEDYRRCRAHWVQVLDAAHQRATLSWAVSKKFRVVQQGLWPAIEAAARTTRNVHRAHLTRAQALAAGLFTGVGGGEGEGEGQEGGGAEAVEDVDLEAFDDSELYQQLLRDYMQAGGGGVGVGGLAGLGRSSGRASRKKKVDTKASKGRKIRYSVHPKLEHFMFPVDPPCPTDRNRLFASLPGRVGRATAAAEGEGTGRG
jgi:protein AATF/BFR2